MATTNQQTHQPATANVPPPSAAPTRPSAQAEHVDAVVTDPFARRRALADKVVEAIYLLFGVVNALIVLRVVLRALGANPANPFADFVYGTSAPFLTPFVGPFPPTQLGTGILEWHAIVAVIVYSLVAWLLAKLAWLLLWEPRSAVRSHATSVDTELR